MPELRVIVIESEIPNVLVGQALEKDLCVQGDSVEDIERRMHLQIQFHTGNTIVYHDGDDLGTPSEDNMDQIPEAPKKFFDMWDASEGYALRSVSY